MAEQYAQASTSKSNRAKPRENANSKVVYKPVVENPFNVDWPSVPMNVQNAILARAITLFEGVAEYHIQSASAKKLSKKRSHGGNNPRPAKRKRLAEDAGPTSAEDAEPTSAEDAEPTSAEAEEHMDQDNPVASTSAAAETQAQPAATSNLQEPEILQHLTFGINEVTKVLERASQSFRRTVGTDTSEDQAQYPLQHPRIVLACRADVNPPKLLAHLPYLVSACNSSRRAEGLPGHIRDDIYLVSLGKGAELALANAIGLRRVSALAIHSTAPELVQLIDLLEKVPVLRSSWLVPPIPSANAPPVAREIIPTHIKMLKTTAPKDMKAAKEARTKKRTAAKERGREKKAATASKVLKRRTVLK